jgi:DNA-directed RNA polymerase subunit RPC12/RpoP
MVQDYYCPKCSSKLEVMDSWGSVSYFCTECKTLISRKKILNKEQIKENKEKSL